MEQEWLTDNKGKYYIDPKTHNTIYENGSSSGVCGISGHSEGFGNTPAKYFGVTFKNTKEYEEFQREVDDFHNNGPKYQKWINKRSRKEKLQNIKNENK